MSAVTAADVLHALVRHVAPLFDARALLVCTCPSSKADDIASTLSAEHGVPARVIGEEALNAAFAQEAADEQFHGEVSRNQWMHLVRWIFLLAQGGRVMP